MFNIPDNVSFFNDEIRSGLKAVAYRNFMSFLGTWNDVYLNGTSLETDLRKRPVGTSLLYDNTTMTAAWIETEHSNVTRLHEQHGRIINNVTLAMPHPGMSPWLRSLTMACRHGN